MVSDKNLKKSFERVKKDIIGLQNRILDSEKRYEDLWNIISSLMEKDLELSKDIEQTAAIASEKPKAPKSKKVTYVASKTAKKFHLLDCPFAKQILPNKKITFKSKDSAMNKGLKPCDCVKKY